MIQAPRKVNGLNGIQAETIDSVLFTIEADIRNGINKFLLFPVPGHKKEKDFDFSFAVNAVRRIKENFGSDVWIAPDVCLCSYTSHGHCGILNGDHSRLLNSPTVEVLHQYSILLAAAGADCIAPSDMTDGRIAAIRNGLNVRGYDEVAIMSYAAKFSSQWYGPFRDACHSAPATKGLQNRKTYQLSPFSPNDAIASALRDEKEGADILMVKPAGLYTDMISKLRQQTLKPIAAYHVSGEYAMLKAAHNQGYIDFNKAILETMLCFKRAGSDIIWTYAALEVARLLKN